MTSHRSLWPYIWLIAALVVYSLPWQWHPAAALTLNAYDLAEWHSVLASSQNSLLAFIVSLCLRLPLLVMGVVFAVQTLRTDNTMLGLLNWFVVLLLVIAQLPPLTALFNIFSDANNAQQIALAGLTLLLAIGINWGPVKSTRWLSPLVLGIGIAASIFALMQTIASFGNLGIAVQLGGGSILLILFFTLELVLSWRRVTS